jgi:anoctamin-10
MKSYGDVNEAYVEKNRGIFRRCFGIGKYDKRDFSQKKLKNIWDW